MWGKALKTTWLSAIFECMPTRSSHKKKDCVLGGLMIKKTVELEVLSAPPLFDL